MAKGEPHTRQPEALATIPLARKVEIAGQLVVRARVFFDLWRFYEGVENRSKILNTMNVYPDFFRFDSYAHFTSFIIHLSTLFDNTKGTISFPRNLIHLKKEGMADASAVSYIQKMLKNVEISAKGIARIRNDFLAHRSGVSEYNEVFRRASVTPDEIDALVSSSFDISNSFFRAAGLSAPPLTRNPLFHVRAMLRDLGATELHEEEKP